MRNSIKVLVIDDDEQMRSMISTALTASGCEVVQAADGVEGFARALEDEYTMLFVDVMMPRKDGLTLLAELQADARTSQRVVVMMTSLADESIKTKAVEMGAYACIQKDEVGPEYFSTMIADLQKKV